ncbi:MAG TPA: ribosomal protein S18-alanine N-acetyltransferase [Fimbriimonas sp.]|nr:ribosomal protein S18-alanine N-acetyltransferase [Fimbriimonas sp.]
MLTTLRFEPLREDRVPRLLEIEREVNSAPWSERSFRHEVSHPQGIFLTAIADGEVVGYGGIWLVIDEAHVTTLAVAPTHQRQGIGRWLLVELLNRARAKGMTCATLEVRASNEAAIALYKKLGFQESARRKSYYPDNKEDALVMWLYELDTWEAPSK